ncbi:MAG: hypothetical protein QOJ92_2642 [Frankiales bacterium]|nr:hypothetical protein [Frankiales bacterium]
MSPLFRRNRADDSDGSEYDDAAETAPAAEDVLPATPGPTTGPWDVEDVPADDIPRLDLGGMLVPVTDKLELRIEVNEEQHIVGATLVDGPSTLQINVFAAPRTDGIWDEVRGEIAESLIAGGGSASDSQGRFGTELVARIPTEMAGRGVVQQSARFLGVDGPRWFLRGLLTGPGSTDLGAAVRLEDAFGEVVVVRGSEAMAARDPLPLKLPRDAAEAAAAAAAAAEEDESEDGDRPSLDPFERGPEITETR